MRESRYERLLTGILAAAGVAVGALACSGDVAGSGGAPQSTLPGYPPSAYPSGFASTPGVGGTVAPAIPGTVGVPAATVPVAAPSSTAFAPAPATAPVPVSSGLPGTSSPYAVPDPAAPALEARTWKLTHEQYRRSIQALLGTEVPLEDENGPRLAPETSNGVFLNLSDSGFVSIANGLAEGYMEIASEVSEGATEAQLASIGSCSALDASCTKDGYLTAALGKVFRRPANAEDLAAFGSLFDAAQAEAATVGDAAFAYRSVLKAMLTSPFFLYRTEIGTDASQEEFQLTPHEVASFLSYSLLGQPPSETLLAAAAGGTLGDTASLAAQTATLLAEPAAALQFERFMTEWLEVEAFLDPDFGLGRDGMKVVSGFDDVKAAMLAESEEFVAQNGTLEGTVTALLTTPVQTSDAALASFYQSEPTGAGAPTERIGVLGLSAGLAMRAKDASTSPTLRGLFVRERLMCQHFTVPADVITDTSELEARESPETTRELYELHALDPTCAACHAIFDPLGFTLETFDEVGRFRSAQSGVAIDTTATLIASDVDQELNNHVDLANALAESTWVRECLSRQAFRYYFGVTTSLELDASGTRREENRGLPPIQAGRAALAGEGTLRAMVTALLSSESTFLRTRREPEQP